MKIEKLNTDNLRGGVFCAHGKPKSEEMYDQMEAWLDGNLLRGQIARADNGDVAGFVLYYPIEEAPLDVEGEGLYMVQCVYVKPEYQKAGAGKALVEAAMADARKNGATGLAAEGFSDRINTGFEYKPGAFFAHMGMTATDTRGQGTLYYVGFNAEAEPPRYLEPDFKPKPHMEPRIKVDILDCRRCYTFVHNRNLVETVLAQVGEDKVTLEVHDQNDRAAILDKGMSTGVFIDGKLTFFDGPISEDDIMNAIEIAYNARLRSTDR